MTTRKFTLTEMPDWPRLMSLQTAAAYVEMSPNAFSQLPIKPRRVGSRVLYDKRDIDQWADDLSDTPRDGAQQTWAERIARCGM
jgi:predicted DNA-binding transcriptional regulator AlpA